MKHRHCTGGGWAPAALEHTALHRHLDGRTRTGLLREIHGEAREAIITSVHDVKRREVRLEAAVLVAEAERLPASRRERSVLEHDRALCRQSLRRTAEQVLAGNREHHIRRRHRPRGRHDLHSNLRRNKFFNLDGTAS